MDLDKISQSASLDAEIGNQLDSDVGKVLRNTYMLLGASIAFSAVMAGISMLLRVPYMGLWMLLPYFALLFMIEKNKNKGAGIFWVFALTGFMGVTLGPILSAVLALRGPEPIMLALGSTALTFFAASAYVLKTRKNLSAIGGFLFIGIAIAFIGGIANMFLQMPALTLTVSCMFAVLSTGIIMWQTSEIIHGGERNYISATVTLFVMIYNLFSILLSFFGMSDD
ncbi:MAG: Bax inhibitor-1/YccA family protein [Cellvibrionales bacterium]|nr:Bax inhibitor-1/YccA family protein [Porticoccaceae bacterium]|tara:strand:- start:20829 stop:21503 length:675 start_codon:yes stop_codon:yes gene_type:complete